MATAVVATAGSGDETALPGVLLVLAVLACVAMINSAGRAISQLWQVMKELLRMLTLAFFAALVLLAVILFAIADRLPN